MQTRVCMFFTHIDWSVNVNVLVVVCHFSCLLIKTMQNVGKAVPRREKRSTINSDWIQPAGMLLTSHEGICNNREELKCFILTFYIDSVWIFLLQIVFWVKICLNLFVQLNEIYTAKCLVCIYWHISVNCKCLFWTCRFLFCLASAVKNNSEEQNDQLKNNISTPSWGSHQLNGKRVVPTWEPLLCSVLLSSPKAEDRESPWDIIAIHGVFLLYKW